MIKVIDPGFYTSIQDKGRFGFQNYGVPVSGCMDENSAEIANQILENLTSSALLELTMTGCSLEFKKDTIIAVTGSDMNAKLNGSSIQMYNKIDVKKGDLLSFDRFEYGFRTYIAFQGGIKSEKVMKSRSMYNGITKSFKIQKNDKIVLNNSINKSRSTNQEKIQKLILSDNIECYKGPEFHKLSKENKENLLKKQFSISNNHNRMGYILNEKIKNNIKPIITSHVMPGTVQLTPGGKIIILMRDCQTTGGYPRILQLTNSAINILSQKMTNSEIKFNIK
ncbi:MAG: biotin-dependent carboxyltransferase family protein [Flavobacteriaceae bacterium]|jgi:biotin-dependent carboxylase-like uncharacterized protein|nr:biotin-dependent carboxyltransferase family protein [Flavobacteriaceae bacterium]MBT4112654.1 biotin-dependent carboxyltransferase family protein [Flavobacteriaceae bacterium]MBT4614507.1 biotin-dependent carboxyltransferase family protein [Flavobacteriaceae bacterium]MBT5246960.1 biotin-dependent carboxyltransferase family protein [Flavobacteriaceae bacterium]MBT5650144.1 biotin-dependent carboxyltransferase family protein [Flavobacteriaceae bacterium]